MSAKIEYKNWVYRSSVIIECKNWVYRFSVNNGVERLSVIIECKDWAKDFECKTYKRVKLESCKKTNHYSLVTIYSFLLKQNFGKHVSWQFFKAHTYYTIGVVYCHNSYNQRRAQLWFSKNYTWTHTQMIANLTLDLFTMFTMFML